MTTRRIISCINKEIQETFAYDINFWNWGDFKGINKKTISIGQIERKNKSISKVYIETGNASMVTIYAIMTLVGLFKK